MSTALGRDWITANLPHQGAMSLLEAIVAWDAAHLVARAQGHRDPANPLRTAQGLPIACAIEYGAQAAAAHGALLAARPSGDGMLVAVRSVGFHAARLDDAGEELRIEVHAMGGGEAGVIYHFDVSAEGRRLADGRLTVAFTR